MPKLKLDPKDLFPLYDEPPSSSIAPSSSFAQSYAKAQAHSELVDEYLGLNTEKTEALIYEKDKASGESSGHWREKNYWIGLPVKSMLTPYSEIRRILHDLNLKQDDHIVDLGAGYGRMAFVIGQHYSQVRFTGYEFVKERVASCNQALSQFKYTNVRVEQADVTAADFTLPPAQYYFIYDFGSRRDLLKALEALLLQAKQSAICVIGRGRGIRDLIEQNTPWLSQVVKPEHFAHYSIYRSA